MNVQIPVVDDHLIHIVTRAVYQWLRVYMTW